MQTLLVTADNKTNCVGFKRFFYIVIGAHFYRLNSTFDRTITGDNNNQDIRVDLLHLTQDIETAGRTEIQIEKHQIKIFLTHLLDSIIRALGREWPITVLV